MIKLFFTLVFFTTIVLVKTSALPCILKEYPAGYVCVCNETYCDSYEDAIPPSKESYTLTSSSQGGLRFHTQKGYVAKNQRTFIYVEDFNKASSESTESVEPLIITVFPANEMQKIIGFGGALTGAVSFILSSISSPLRNAIYRSYYSPTKGIGYNMMRMIVGGCDFDLKPWTYAEEPIDDISLPGFTKLNSEDLTKIKQYRELEKETKNYDIKKVAAAWSSPRWMKTNNKWSGRNTLLPQYYQAWAEYYLRWLTLMSQNNMTIWGLSTGNEPLNGIIGFNIIKFISLGFTAIDQGIFLGENLGPLLRSSKFHDIKIIGLDDQRIYLDWWLPQMDKGYHNASEYLDGVGLHWYSDDVAPPTVIKQFSKNYADKIILYTESCIVFPPMMGSWDRAELYIKDYAQNVRYNTQGWLDWNLILNEFGGPNYAHNYVDSAIIVNTTSGTEFYKQPMFYGIGHFSRFLIPNSVQLESFISDVDIFSVTFRRPDKRIVTIIYNSSFKRTTILIRNGNLIKFNLNVPPKSIHTLMYYA